MRIGDCGLRNDCLSADFADHIDYTENRDIHAAKNNRVTTFTPFAKGGLGGISGEDLQNGNGKRGRHLYGYRDCRMNPFPFESSQSVLAGRKYRILGQFALVAKFQILHLQQFISGLLRRLRITERDGASQFNR
jgi:hypothetical protein